MGRVRGVHADPRIDRELVVARVAELRRLRGPGAIDPAARQSAVGHRRSPSLALGLLLIRAGRRLAGPSVNVRVSQAPPGTLLARH